MIKIIFHTYIHIPKSLKRTHVPCCSFDSQVWPTDSQMAVTNQCSAAIMWRQQKQSVIDGRTDKQMDDRQSVPYVVLCFAGTTKRCLTKWFLRTGDRKMANEFIFDANQLWHPCEIWKWLTDPVQHTWTSIIVNACNVFALTQLYTDFVGNILHMIQTMS